MSGKDQQKRPGKGSGAKPGTTGQPAVPQAAEGPVITSAPLSEAAPETPAAPLPPIQSTLVGEGGELPPMPPREAEAVAGTQDASPAEAEGATQPAKAIPAIPEDGADILAEVEAATSPPPNPAPAPRTDPAPGIAPAPRGGFWPLVLGGVVAAGLGAGATFWLAPRLQTLPPPPPPVDIQALKDQILAELPVTTPPATDAEALSEAVSAALREALPQIEAAAADEVARRLAETPAEDAAPAALASAVQALGERLDSLDQRLAAGAATVGQAAGDVSATLQAEITTLRQQLVELAARPVGAATETVDALQTQLAALPARIEALEAREAAQTAALSAAAQLGEALRSGTAAGRDAAAQALTAAGQGAVAGLAQSVPTLAELQMGYDRAARDALSAARAAEPPEPGLGLLGSFLADQTKARSVAPREGDDADAIQSRAGAAVEAGDIPAALAELAALPEVARDAMAPWLREAEAWTAAQAALGQITQPATQSE